MQVKLLLTDITQIYSKEYLEISSYLAGNMLRLHYKDVLMTDV
jgi:hypothetical protein